MAKLYEKQYVHILCSPLFDVNIPSNNRTSELFIEMPLCATECKCVEYVNLSFSMAIW